MVQLCASLISLTLAASLTLALPHPSYTHELNLLERALEEDFPRRENLLDAYAELAARDPSFFSHIGDAFRDVGRAVGKVGKVASDGLHVAEKIAENPIVQAGLSVIPGGGAVLAAEKVVSTIGKIENVVNKANDIRHQVQSVEHAGSALLRSKTVGKALGNAQKFGSAIGRARHIAPPPSRIATHRRHRRDLEDYEELSGRDFDDEELVGRKYDDDFLVERDFFDDLD